MIQVKAKITQDTITLEKSEGKKPERKDPHIEHHYPSSTKNQIFQQYFQLAARTKGDICYHPIHASC